MSQLNANAIGEATVRITADTAPLKEGLAEARAETEQTAARISDSVGGAGKKTAEDFALAAATIAATAMAAFRLGEELEAAAEKMLGLKDGANDVLSAIDDASKEPVQRAKERLDAVRKEILSEDYVSQARRIWTKIWGFTNGIDLESVVVAADAKKEENARELLANAEAAAQKDRIQKLLAAEEIATVEGAERIERKRQEALRKIRTEFKNLDTSDLEAAVNKRYDTELSRFAEAEQKKRESEEERQRQSLLDIEERKRAYSDLIAHQKMKDREHAEALKKSMADFAKTFADQFVSSLDKIEMSLSNIAANTGLLRNRHES